MVTNIKSLREELEEMFLESERSNGAPVTRIIDGKPYTYAAPVQLKAAHYDQYWDEVITFLENDMKGDGSGPTGEFNR